MYFLRQANVPLEVHVCQVGNPWSNMMQIPMCNGQQTNKIFIAVYINTVVHAVHWKWEKDGFAQSNNSWLKEAEGCMPYIA